MKKLILALALTALACGFAAAQKKQLKRVDVTTKTVEALPAGEAYVIDLTRKGAIYNLAPGLDYSRIQIRTSDGLMAMTELLKVTRKSGQMQIGATGDLLANTVDLIGTGGNSLDFSCDRATCTCTGRIDCKLMRNSSRARCGTVINCDANGCTCVRR